MIIRPFETKDLEICASIHRKSRRVSEEGVIYESDLDRHDLNHFMQDWQAWVSDDEIFILVAEGTSGVVGFTIYGRVKTRPDFDKGVVPRFGAEIYALYVDPDRFREGIGKALFLETCKDLADRKLTSLLLWALKKNKRACQFYEALGGERVAKQRVDIGEKSWAEESCFAWRDVRKVKA